MPAPENPGQKAYFDQLERAPLSSRTRPFSADFEHNAYRAPVFEPARRFYEAHVAYHGRLISHYKVLKRSDHERATRGELPGRPMIHSSAVRVLVEFLEPWEVKALRYCCNTTQVICRQAALEFMEKDRAR